MWGSSRKSFASCRCRVAVRYTSPSVKPVPSSGPKPFNLLAAHAFLSHIALERFARAAERLEDRDLVPDYLRRKRKPRVTSRKAAEKVAISNLVRFRRSNNPTVK